MRKTLLCTQAALLSCAAMLIAASSFAQDAEPLPVAPPPEAPPAAQPEPAPAPTPPPDPVPAPGAAGSMPPPVETTPAEAAPAEDEPAPAWFRIDSDGAGLQLWAGATHPLGEGIGLATDIYVLQTSSSYGEFDIGPAITAGPLIITPMIGLQVNWSTKRAAAIVPQLYVTGGPDPIYLELWVQNYNYTPFKDASNHDLYFRFFIDYKVSSYFAIGPQAELTMALNEEDPAGEPRETGILSLPVGGSVMLSNYGKGSALLLFAGYETNEDARLAAGDAAFAGRLTFVHNF